MYITSKYWQLWIMVFLLGMFQTGFAQVVVSELMWMGTDLSSADEWVELYSDNEVDISHWTLSKQSSSGSGENVLITFATGTVIEAKTPFVISNYTAADSRLAVEPDVIDTALSLPNTKLKLLLRNDSGDLIDVVDDGIGAPMAGENNSGTGARLSMIRIDVDVSGDDPAAWVSASEQCGWDTGYDYLFGSPGFLECPDDGSGGSNSSLSSSSSSSSSSTSSGSSSSSTSSTSSTSSASDTSATSAWSGLIISEVMSNPVGADTYEWIELANLSSSAMLLTDVMLSDEQNEHVFSEVELQSGEYRSFSKDITGLALQNDGELLRLSYSGITIDQMGYRETYEGVSIGRMPESDELAVFCGPSPNVENTMEPTAITIDVQSGQLQAHGATSVNLQALAASGTSLKNVSCLWQFGELDVSTSCNPLSYRFEAVGEHTVTLEATNVCQQTQTSSLLVTILPPVTTTSTTSTYNSSSTNDSDADCKHDGDDQVVISEFIPNPTGSDDEEWIELYNPTNQIIELCNLWLDDSEGGSSPYRLDDYSIAAYSYLVIPRASSRLALNNTDDAARLLIKERQNYNVQSEVFYQSSNEGQSYSLREDGEYAWTPYVSPGEENTFKTYNRQHEYETIVISSALPNPDGQDSGAEWLELTNISDTEQILDGWYLENAKKSNVLGGMLQPGAVKRFIAKDVGITLKNTEDTLKLYSPDTMLQSTLTWTKAVSGRVYERVELFNDIIEVNVTEIIDGDTVEVEIEDVSLLPQDVQEQLGVFTGDVTFTVRMLGIDAPETNHPTEAVEQYGAEAKELVHDLLLQETVQLTFDEARLGKYNRVLAYVTLPDGHSVQEILLRRGLAQMYDTYPFSQLDWYQLLQQEAEVDEIGMWSDPNVADVKEVAGVAEVSQLEQTSDISATSATLVVEQITYTPIKLQFREIYSAPNDDEDEWIVLYNPTNENVNLTGYILDDVRDGGSKQHILGNYIINAQSELYLPSFITLNNNGDEVWLLTPDAQHSISLEIPKLKHGQSYALVVEEWCVTDQPTPYEQNICTIKSAVTSLKQISSKQISTVTPITDRWVTYENTIEGNLSSEPLRADWVEDLLTTQAIASDGTESSTASIWSEIIQLVLILLFAGGGMYWWIRKK